MASGPGYRSGRWSRRSRKRPVCGHKPGVFAALTEQLGDAGVSIDKLIQESAGDTGVAPIAIMTHPCPRSAVESALQNIAELKITADTPRLLRIETRA